MPLSNSSLFLSAGACTVTECYQLLPPPKACKGVFAALPWLRAREKGWPENEAAPFGLGGDAASVGVEACCVRAVFHRGSRLWERGGRGIGFNMVRKMKYPSTLH